MPSNVEIKARVEDPAALKTLALDLIDAGHCEVFDQVDTFFHCTTGRLKLREIKNKPDRASELISYIRPDKDGPKHSEFSVTYVNCPESLKTTLGLALGVRGVVKKTRTLIMIGQTKLHIDEVEGLGSFMELEVVIRSGQSLEEGAAIAQSLMEKLNIHQSALISGAYMDLLQL